MGAGIASAHVTVNPNTAVAGSYTKLTFRVPNESAKASTVKLTVNFPMDHPFASVSIKKQPGWAATTTTSKLSAPISDDDNATITQAVSSITWTADASGKIALGEFAEFDVSVGPVPKVPSIAFEAIQTYDDGSVVKWDQPTPASGAEPEHPAPVLTISAATDDWQRRTELRRPLPSSSASSAVPEAPRSRPRRSPRRPTTLRESSEWSGSSSARSGCWWRLWPSAAGLGSSSDQGANHLPAGRGLADRHRGQRGAGGFRSNT